MDVLVSLVKALTNAEPAALIACVSIVALLVVGECVRILSKRRDR